MNRIPMSRSNSSLIRRAVPVLLLLSLAPCVRAEEIVCRANFDWAVEVNGNYPRDVFFYQTNTAKKFFVDVPAVQSGLLLDLVVLKVFAVPRTLIYQTGGSLKFKNPSDSPSYPFSVLGPVIQFEAEGTKFRIVPVLSRPPLIGLVALDDLVADRPEYRERMSRYTPDAVSLAVLSKAKLNVELEVFFATWCRYCKEFVPKLLRVLKDANNPELKFKLVGLPRGFGKEPGLWQERNVTSIPSVIVKIDGREITRLGIEYNTQPEVKLAGILQSFL
jgi:thiol-disulfide isomerase/thioredoxin